MKLLVPLDKEAGWKYVIAACEAIGIGYHKYDIYSENWIYEARKADVIGCIYRPEFRYQSWMKIFSERIRALHEYLRIPIYPSVAELTLYESKREMASWLQAHEVPHAKTHVFCRPEDADKFLLDAAFPMIHKTDFGNAGSGVRILTKKKEADKIVRAAFSGGYSIPSYDPQRVDAWRRIKHVVRPAYRAFRGIRHFPPNREIDSVIFQEFIDISAEWRVVKIGRWYFGHDKLPDVRGLRSGGAETTWSVPRLQVFELARHVCEKGSFNSMAVDIFEDRNGRLYVNELQTVFGVVADNQMYRITKDKKEPFAYYYDAAAESWKERHGAVGQDYCYRLRAVDFLMRLGIAPPINPMSG